MHRRAQACARLAVSWAALPYRGQGPRPYCSPSCRVAALTRAPLRSMPRAPCPAPLRALPRAPAHRAVRVVGLHGRIAAHRLPYLGRVLCAHLAVSWPRSRYSPAFSPPSCHNTPWCIAIQSLLPAFLSHYTSSVLRYNLPPSQLAFQPAIQYLYYNTILAKPTLPSCNTITVLQYNFPATHFTLSHNTP